MKRASVSTLRLPKPTPVLVAAGVASAATWRRLTALMSDRYRPERHYMRGPGPKWHAVRLPSRNAGDRGATMRAQIALILGIALSALAAVDPKAAAAAGRREQPMLFELLHEGPAEACGSSCGAWGLCHRPHNSGHAARLRGASQYSTTSEAQ